MQQWWWYLAARWGSSTAVHSWELCNEADPNDPAVYRQTQDFARFMHTVDAHRHLVTTSFWCCWVAGVLGRRRRNTPTSITPTSTSTRRTRRSASTWSSGSCRSTRRPARRLVGKPVILGETGIGYAGQPYFEDLKRANPGIWYHNMLWAQLLSASGLSSPNYWWSEHLAQIDRRQIARPFAQFVTTLDVNRGGYVDAAATVTNARSGSGARRTWRGKTAYLWIQNRQHNWHNVMGVESPEPVTAQSGSVTLRMTAEHDLHDRTLEHVHGRPDGIPDAAERHRWHARIAVSNLTDDFAVKVKGPSAGVPSTPQGLRIIR